MLRTCVGAAWRAGSLSSEQKAVLARKEKELSAARVEHKSKGAAKASLSRHVSVWQRELDEEQLAKVAAK